MSERLSSKEKLQAHKREQLKKILGKVDESKPLQQAQELNQAWDRFRTAASQEKDLEKSIGFAQSDGTIGGSGAGFEYVDKKISLSLLEKLEEGPVDANQAQEVVHQVLEEAGQSPLGIVKDAAEALSSRDVYDLYRQGKAEAVELIQEVSSHIELVMAQFQSTSGIKVDGVKKFMTQFAIFSLVHMRKDAIEHMVAQWWNEFMLKGGDKHISYSSFGNYALAYEASDNLTTILDKKTLEMSQTFEFEDMAAAYIKSLAQVWRDRDRYELTHKSSEMTVVVMQPNSRGELVPDWLKLDTRQNLDWNGLAQSLLTSSQVNAERKGLTTGHIINLNREAIQSIPAEEKSTLFRYFAEADVILNPFSSITYQNWQDRTRFDAFNGNFGASLAISLGKDASGRWKFFSSALHSDLNGLPHRKLSQAILDQLAQDASNYKVELSPDNKYDTQAKPLPEYPDLTSDQIDFYKAIPREFHISWGLSASYLAEFETQISEVRDMIESRGLGGTSLNLSGLHLMAKVNKATDRKSGLLTLLAENNTLQFALFALAHKEATPWGGEIHQLYKDYLAHGRIVTSVSPNTAREFIQAVVHFGIHQKKAKAGLSPAAYLGTVTGLTLGNQTMIKLSDMVARGGNFFAEGGPGTLLGDVDSQDSFLVSGRVKDLAESDNQEMINFLRFCTCNSEFSIPNNLSQALEQSRGAAVGAEMSWLKNKQGEAQRALILDNRVEWIQVLPLVKTQLAELINERFSTQVSTESLAFNRVVATLVMAVQPDLITQSPLSASEAIKTFTAKLQGVLPRNSQVDVSELVQTLSNRVRQSIIDKEKDINKSMAFMLELIKHSLPQLTSVDIAQMNRDTRRLLEHKISTDHPKSRLELG